MRNGDYLPTRFEGQSDAVNLIANSKTSQNPENTVGLITMAGKRVEVLQTLVQDPTELLTALHNVEIGGDSDLASALQVAQLALKHRSNKNGSQRIIVFVGSPIAEDAKELTRLGKKLKKSGINLDVVSLGDDLEGDERLAALVESVDKSGSSHLVHVPAGSGMIADVLLSTPVFFSGDTGDAGAAGGAADGNAGGAAQARPAGGFPMGVDPNVDPELYEAIQASLREQAEREAPATVAATPAGAGIVGATPAAPKAPATAASNNNINANDIASAATPATPIGGGGGGSTAHNDSTGVIPMDLGDDMDEEMRSAIALSLQMQQQGDGDADNLYKSGGATTGTAAAAGTGPAAAAVDDEEAEALKLSLALAEQQQSEEKVKSALQDQNYVKSLFGDLPVDLDNASIQEALQSITKGGDAAKKDEPKKKSDEDKKKDDKDGDANAPKKPKQ